MSAGDGVDVDRLVNLSTVVECQVEMLFQKIAVGRWATQRIFGDVLMDQVPLQVRMREREVPLMAKLHKLPTFVMKPWQFDVAWKLDVV